MFNLFKRSVPEQVRAAAERAAIRTFAQSLGAFFGVGISVNAIVALISGGADLVTAGVTLGVAVLSPFAAAASSYFDIVSKGIPGDYQVDDPSETDQPDQAYLDD